MERKKYIPDTTMNKYVKNIMSIYDFNVQEKVSNKTESRSTAEFSVRSTIAYMMVVLTTHFTNAPLSKFHSRLKDLSNNPLYALMKDLNKKMLGSELSDDELRQLIYVLPNLITSTDECSLFITNQTICNKVSWCFCLRLSLSLKPNVDSNRRDNYTTKQVGDAHLCGIHISLNNTFSAGGHCAPIFACVFGLKPSEMPLDEIVICRVKGLVASSDSTGTMKEGFIVFIRGKYENNEEGKSEQTNLNPNSSNNDTNDDDDISSEDSSISNDDVSPDKSDLDSQSYQDSSVSKESRVAKIYRELVYYPFIRDIRVDEYDMDPKTKAIPSNLNAVSWMDGCHGQLKLIMTEKVLDTEKDLKIISCKCSVARTSVEQASDVGPMFKGMKSSVKKMPPTNSGSLPLFIRLTGVLEQLEHLATPDCRHVVILPTHKKNAIVVGLSKLPTAMGTAYSAPNIKSAFRDIGQIDETNEVIPNEKNLLGTYRGSIGEDHHALHNAFPIIKKYYDDTFLNGKVSEDKFDEDGVEYDCDSTGTIVSRYFDIARENCQRSKVLSCQTQHNE